MIVKPELVLFFEFLQSLEISECNGNFQDLVFERVRSYASLRSKTYLDLTLSEFSCIVKSCSKEFSISANECRALVGAA